MLITENNKFWSDANKLLHSGYYSRSKKIRESDKIARYIADKAKSMGIKAEYDMEYGNTPMNLIYTECFGATGSIIIHPGSFDLWTRMSERLIDTPVNDKRVERFINAGDKYASVNQHQFEDGTFDKVVILPGSNLLPFIDLPKVKKIVESGAMVKPHPITQRADMYNMKTFFGVDNVIPKLESGWSVIKAANEIHCTLSTELGLYAALRGKKIKLIRYSDSMRVGTYYVLYKYLPNLKNLLSTHLSGVITLDDDYEKQVDEYFDYYLRCYSEYSSGNNKKNVDVPSFD